MASAEVDSPTTSHHSFVLEQIKRNKLEPLQNKPKIICIEAEKHHEVDFTKVRNSCLEPLEYSPGFAKEAAWPSSLHNIPKTTTSDHNFLLKGMRTYFISYF